MKTVRHADFAPRFEEQLLYANFHLREDVLNYLRNLRETVDNSYTSMVDVYLRNHEIAATEKRGLCQDTGYVQVYVRQGRDVNLDFDLQPAVNASVEKIYHENHLRFSLAHPLNRTNTGSNTPAFVDWEPGDPNDFEVTILLKGGGSENVSRAGFLLPTASRQDIIDWVRQTVEQAGAKACPPYVLGVCVGGNQAKSAYYAKRVLTYSLDHPVMTEEEADLARAIQDTVNTLPIGFQGFRFGETAMGVFVKLLPCHIATLPLAVSIGCNAVRQGYFRL